MARQAFEIAGQSVQPGEVKRIDLPVAHLYTGTQVSVPVHVIHGRRSGPVVFISAAIHGDELNGIEIIKRVLRKKSLHKLKGTLIAVPIVNVYGVINQSRYLPDRRDLNRSFPGSRKGSLAARLANLFLEDVVALCDYGIDLHTGAIHRSNLPQIRADLDDPITLGMARAFGVPVLLNANLRDGSLRQAAADKDIKVLLYEAGEALRFDEISIRAGVRGVLNVLRHLGMLPALKQPHVFEPYVARAASWVRAGGSGLVVHLKSLGDKVHKGEIIAQISDPFGDSVSLVAAPADGIIIGKQNIPLVQEGDAMFNLAYFSALDEVRENVEAFHDTLTPESHTAEFNPDELITGE